MLELFEKQKANFRHPARFTNPNKNYLYLLLKPFLTKNVHTSFEIPATSHQLKMMSGKEEDKGGESSDNLFKDSVTRMELKIAQLETHIDDLEKELKE